MSQMVAEPWHKQGLGSLQGQELRQNTRDDENRR
jgi:hypothetical protein